MLSKRISCVLTLRARQKQASSMLFLRNQCIAKRQIKQGLGQPTAPSACL